MMNPRSGHIAGEAKPCQSYVHSHGCLRRTTCAYPCVFSVCVCERVSGCHMYVLYVNMYLGGLKTPSVKL